MNELKERAKDRRMMGPQEREGEGRHLEGITHAKMQGQCPFYGGKLM